MILRERTATRPNGETTVRAAPSVACERNAWELRESREPAAGNVDLRKLAIDAFNKHDDDTFSAQLRRVDSHIEGHLDANTGILRFAGKIIADFSRDNLQEQKPANAQNKPKPNNAQNKTTRTVGTTKKTAAVN